MNQSPHAAGRVEHEHDFDALGRERRNDVARWRCAGGVAADRGIDQHRADSREHEARYEDVGFHFSSLLQSWKTQ
jgi:hypothetical protein